MLVLGDQILPFQVLNHPLFKQLSELLTVLISGLPGQWFPEGTYLKASFNCLSVQFSSVAQSCPTLCDPMNRSMPGLPVHHQLPEFTQTHVH